MTQKTADPAPANQRRGNEHNPTAAYCCAKLNSRPKRGIIQKHNDIWRKKNKFHKTCTDTVQSTSILQNPPAPMDQISAHLRGPREKVGVFDVKVGAFDVTIP
jgi:hypothetical protein